ncbi:DUF493 family protein [Myxococcota bacterium]|nr:DUF493 family protein [Myxococcota bacterium]
MTERTESEWLDLLREGHTWPGEFTFKFIVPVAKVEEAKEILPGAEIAIRASKKGNYQSLSVRAHFQKPEEVLKVYERAKLVEGLIAL